MCNKNRFVVRFAKNNLVKKVDIAVKNQKIYTDLAVKYGANMDKRTTLVELFKYEKEDFDWFEKRNTDLVGVKFFGACVFRHPKKGSTIYEYNFLVETFDKWEAVIPKPFTQPLNSTRSKNNLFYYAQILSVKAEGPPLPDSNFTERCEKSSLLNSCSTEVCCVSSKNLNGVLDLAQYNAYYFDREGLVSSNGKFIKGVIENFVEDTMLLGGQEYIEKQTKLRMDRDLGWLQYLGPNSKFWSILNAFSGVGGGGQARTGTVQTIYSMSQPGTSISPVLTPTSAISSQY